MENKKRHHKRESSKISKNNTSNKYFKILDKANNFLVTTFKYFTTDKNYFSVETISNSYSKYIHILV